MITMKVMLAATASWVSLIQRIKSYSERRLERLTQLDERIRQGLAIISRTEPTRQPFGNPPMSVKIPTIWSIQVAAWKVKLPLR